MKILKRLAVLIFILSLFSVVSAKVVDTVVEIRYTEVVTNEWDCFPWKIVEKDYYHYTVCRQSDMTLDSSVVSLFEDTTLIIRQTLRR